MKRLITILFLSGAILFSVPNNSSAHCGMYHGPLSATGYYYSYPAYSPPVYYYPSYPQYSYYGPVYYGPYRQPVTTYRYNGGVRGRRVYSNYRSNTRYRWRW